MTNPTPDLHALSARVAERLGIGSTLYAVRITGAKGASWAGYSHESALQILDCARRDFPSFQSELTEEFEPSDLRTPAGMVALLDAMEEQPCRDGDHFCFLIEGMGRERWVTFHHHMASGPNDEGWEWYSATDPSLPAAALLAAARALEIAP